MNQRQWWNGRWSRLARRDVFLRSAADGRWQVELRRGGAGGRLRTRAFESERGAVDWVESAVLDIETGWREVLSGTDRRAPGKVARRLRRAG
jgi:hypothetical protein